MNAPHTSRTGGRGRRAFTLVELLVVITVIGILVGLLITVGAGLFNTAEEFTINNEVQQMSASVEQFHTKFGFYPPDMTEFVDASGVPLNFTDQVRFNPPSPSDPTVEKRLLSFLEKISRTHREREPEPTNLAQSRLEYWWNTVGKEMVAVDGILPGDTNDRFGNPYRVARGPRVALWFWLSQLYNDASYPLSGGARTKQAEENKQVFFDFTNRQLERLRITGNGEVFAFPGDPDGNGIVYPNYTGRVKLYQYLQAGGADLPYVYFHNKNYLIGEDLDFANVKVAGTVYQNRVLACQIPVNPPPPIPSFFNENSFQILSPGADESFGNVFALDQLTNPLAYTDRDNICNFSEGRIDVFVDRETN